MSVEVQPPHNPTHIENLMWGAQCFTCPDYSEEDGTTYDPPQTIVEWVLDRPYSEVMAAVEKHLAFYAKVNQNVDHRVVVTSHDFGKIRDALNGS